ncbi:MAG TPA: hypothetical protein PLZ00_06095 [Mangrovimonas sp.]|nr:hypothetical protein [Mangrovimonas sp.]
MEDDKKKAHFDAVMQRIIDDIKSGKIKPDNGNLRSGGYRVKSYSEMMEDERKIEEILNSLNNPERKEKKINNSQKSKLLGVLKEVQKIQNSDLKKSDKVTKIKYELWTKHNAKTKLLIGGFLGTIFGFTIFGTGGIGIAALGGATGIWGFLAGTAGGVLISSLIQNFEKKK